MRALLAKAESTEFPQEAEALTARAQEMMARHSIDLALLEQDPEEPEAAAARRLPVDSPTTSTGRYCSTRSPRPTTAGPCGTGSWA